jgi:acyl-CoA synthetase (AMP-forming)/AMP-acid ligase II
VNNVFSEFWNRPDLPSNQDALIFCDSVTTWGGLRKLVGDAGRQLAPLERSRIGLHFVAAASSYALFLACQSLPVDLFLLDGSLSEPQCVELGRELRLNAVVFPAPNAGPNAFAVQKLVGANDWSGTSTVTILSSGSTGKPKAARHTWESLLRPVRPNDQSGARWLLTYRPHLYAGVQVALQCLAEFGALAVPKSTLSPAEIAGFIADCNSQCVSATPSYWRRLLLLSGREALSRMDLRQITLGGEVVDQPVLDALHTSFPKARVVHIYATTELGRCFSVADGLAGFPQRFLDAPPPGNAVLKIVEGELVARSSNAMKCYDHHNSGESQSPDWIRTGDLVSVAGNRIHFVGRKTEMINVGGNKVYPLEVEQIVRNVPGVADVRVFGRTSSITGQLVSCEIVSATGFEDEKVKHAVQQVCSVSLLPHQRPRLINMVNNIELSEAYKTVRSVS